VTEQSWLGLNPELDKKQRDIESLAKKIQAQKLEAIQEGSDKSSEGVKEYQELVSSLMNVLGKAESKIAEQASYLKVLEGHDEQHFQELAKMRKAVLRFGDCLTESINGDGNTLKQVQHEIENLTVSLGRFTDVVLKALETKQEGPNAVLEREVLLKIKGELDESHGKDKLQYSR
jgi:hypothetical protein